MLNTISIDRLNGVGPRTQTLLADLGIFSVQDLLFHLPLRYQDRTQITPIAAVVAGNYALIEGEIVETRVISGGKRSLMCRLVDDSGQLWLRFFHFNQSQRVRLQSQGLVCRCFGVVRKRRGGKFEMIHPEYQLTPPNVPLVLEAQLTPIYPTTKGLNQTTWRKLISQALAIAEKLSATVELLPTALFQQFHAMPIMEALKYIHWPPKDAPVDQLQQGIHVAQKRLAFEELLAHQVSLQRLRLQWKRLHGCKMQPKNNLAQKLLAALSFNLTQAQKKVCHEIYMDLSSQQPMLRLVQGDVGSGKTIVAALAMLRVVENGYQAALMAPTELLAEQHFQNFLKWFAPLNLQVEVLFGNMKIKQRRAVMQQFESGEAHIIVGTHALFQQSVNFAKLGLIVVDEQHRFGVHQRLLLKEKGIVGDSHPHQLIMTATPIPRTLAMTAYADLDVSIIDELPPHRRPIKTCMVANERRDEVVARVAAHCESGQQAYWVCTLIQESEALQCQAAEEVYRQLKQCLQHCRVGLIHGRQSKDEKERTMQAFHQREMDLLVATTVIEVGVDVPNASLMIIENAERLGLSQIHQLRGRVGRGRIQSFCVLLYQKPLSKNARERLVTCRETQDGFLIAQKDLTMRGPGELLGAKQAGELHFRIADLSRDQDLLDNVQKVAAILLKQYPNVVNQLLARWIIRSEAYATV